MNWQRSLCIQALSSTLKAFLGSGRARSMQLLVSTEVRSGTTYSLVHPRTRAMFTLQSPSVKRTKSILTNSYCWNSAFIFAFFSMCLRYVISTRWYSADPSTNANGTSPPSTRLFDFLRLCWGLSLDVVLAVSMSLSSTYCRFCLPPRRPRPLPDLLERLPGITATKAMQAYQF